VHVVEPDLDKADEYTEWVNYVCEHVLRNIHSGDDHIDLIANAVESFPLEPNKMLAAFEENPTRLPFISSSMFTRYYKIFFLFLCLTPCLCLASNIPLRQPQPIKDPFIYEGKGFGVEFQVFHNLWLCSYRTQCLRYDYFIFRHNLFAYVWEEDVLWYNIKYKF
jgi:hypothetical protein